MIFLQIYKKISTSTFRYMVTPSWSMFGLHLVRGPRVLDIAFLFRNMTTEV